MTPLMLVGTFHFASTLDMVVIDPGAMDTPPRQTELDAIAADLATFAPTKILIERPYADRDDVAAHYRAVRDGTRTPGRDESEQLGYRLAARAGLDTVHAIDIMHRFAEPELDQLLATDPEVAARYHAMIARATASAAATTDALAAGGIRAALVAENLPHARRDALALYTDAGVQLVDAAGYTGADMVGNWYHRNVRIFANLRRTTEPGDRLLVLYGSGHIPILAHLAESSGAYELIDPVSYLRRTVDRTSPDVDGGYREPHAG